MIEDENAESAATKDDAAEKPTAPEFTAERAREIVRRFCTAQNFQTWRDRVRTLYQIYEARYDMQYDKDELRGGGRLNHLYSNVQTLAPAVFSRLPEPQISPKNKNADNVARGAAIILEDSVRQIAEKSDLFEVIDAANLERLISGLGQIWVTFRPDQTFGYTLGYDRVGARDFGFTPDARSWPEVREVWRVKRLSYYDILQKYGVVPTEEMREGDEHKAEDGPDKANKLADDVFPILEFWHKPTQSVYHLAACGKGEFLKVTPDPLRLPGFFPCPKPLIGVKRYESMCPVPDYDLYENIARDAEKLATAISKITEFIKVRGFYDGSIPEMKDVFKQDNGQLLKVDDFPRFLQKGGIDGSMVLLSIKEPAEVVAVLTQVLIQYEEQINKITGVADILRGEGDARATATSDGIRAKYATLRLGSRQDAMQAFIREIMEMTAHLIAEHYEVADLIALTNSQEIAEDAAPPDDMRPRMSQVAELLKNEKLLSMKVAIETDATVRLNEEVEQKRATEFLSAFVPFLEKAAQVPPEMAPLAGEFIKFAVQRFPVAVTLENEIDGFIEAGKAKAQNPEQKPDPAVQKAQIDAQTKIQVQGMKGEVQIEEARIDARAGIDKAAIVGAARLNDKGFRPYGE